MVVGILKVHVWVETVVVSCVYHIVDTIVKKCWQRSTRLCYRTIAPYVIEQVVHTRAGVLRRRSTLLVCTRVVDIEVDAQLVLLYVCAHTTLNAVVVRVDNNTVLVEVRQRSVVADVLATTSYANVVALDRSWVENHVLPVVLSDIAIILECPLLAIIFSDVRIDVIGCCRINFVLELNEFVSVHHFHLLWYSLPAIAAVVSNLSLTGLSALCSDDDNTVGTTCTVDSRCRSILKNVERLDVVRVDAGCYRSILNWESVDDIERSVGLCQWVVTTDGDVHLSTRHTFAWRYVNTGNTSTKSLVDWWHRSVGELAYVSLGNRTRKVALANRLIAHNYDFAKSLLVFFQYDLHYLTWCSLFFLGVVSEERELQHGAALHVDGECTVDVGNGSNIVVALHLDANSRHSFAGIVLDNSRHLFLRHSSERCSENHHKQEYQSLDCLDFYSNFHFLKV